MQSGFVIIGVPKSGMFIKRGRITDGSGIPHINSFALAIHPTKSTCRSRKIELDRKWGDKYIFKILPIEYSIVGGTK